MHSGARYRPPLPITVLVSAIAIYLPSRSSIYCTPPTLSVLPLVFDNDLPLITFVAALYSSQLIFFLLSPCIVPTNGSIIPRTNRSSGPHPALPPILTSSRHSVDNVLSFLFLLSASLLMVELFLDPHGLQRHGCHDLRYCLYSTYLDRHCRSYLSPQGPAWPTPSLNCYRSLVLPTTTVTENPHHPRTYVPILFGDSDDTTIQPGYCDAPESGP